MPEDAVDVQTNYDAIADVVFDDKPAVAEPKVKSDDAAVVAKPDAEPDKRVESDDDLPAVEGKGKYKTLEEAEKAIAERDKVFGDVEDVKRKLEILDSLNRGLADPTRQKSTIQEVLKQFNIDPSSLADMVTTAEKQNAPFAEALKSVNDDDILEGRQVKTLLQGLVDHLKKEAVDAAKAELGPLMRAFTPILSERREAELTTKFPLLKSPEIRARMDQVADDNDSGKVGSDEIYMKVAAFDMIQEGKIPETLAKEIFQQIEALNTKKRQDSPEPAISGGKTGKGPLTAAQAEQARFDATFDLVPGR